MDARMSSSQPGGDYDLSNPVDSFVEVVGRVVRSPTEFFSSILGGLLRLVWRTRAAGGFRFEGGGYGFGEFLASVILTPIGATIGLFILAGIAHLLVMLFVGSENSGFESTFRVVSYVSVTNLVNWIPFIGGLLALYGLYLAVVGLREMHSTTTGRAALVVLLPIGLILVVVLLVLLVAGGVLLPPLVLKGKGGKRGGGP